MVIATADIIGSGFIMLKNMTGPKSQNYGGTCGAHHAKKVKC